MDNLLSIKPKSLLVVRGFILSIILLIISLFLQTQSASALSSTANFNPGNIMDDVVMSNTTTMSESQIQAFLLSKANCRSTGNGYINQLTIVDNGTRGYLTTAKGTWWWNIKDGHFVCMAEDTFGGETAARIIYQAAQDYKVNPQVLIVLLQKEQGLITDGFPNDHQYAAATGYDCPDTPSGCNNANAGFKNQIRKAARLYHEVLDNTDYDGDRFITNYPVGNNVIQYNPDTSCGSSVVNIKNRATSALYRYTPYQPNAAALAAGYGTAPCGAYGNRNFYLYFNDWFGTTHGFIYNGVDYSSVFDPIYYADKNPDIKQAFGADQLAMFFHYIQYGINEGRQGNTSFNVNSYRARYPDLRAAYGDNLQMYVWHYVTTGKNEGRSGTGDYRGGTTIYDGVDYSSIYNFDYYTKTYPDIWAAYGLDDKKALWHFIDVGINEGRQGNATFNAKSYMTRYFDLRRIYGNNLINYGKHYIFYGKAEGRVGTGSVRGGISSLNGIDYSSVYNFDSYTRKNSDIWTAYGLDDSQALQHFVNYGMAEGRQASAEFNVNVYKNRYSDLNSAYGNNLKQYYLHYMLYGKAEGRLGS